MIRLHFLLWLCYSVVLGYIQKVPYPFPLFQTRISFAPQVMLSILEFFGLTTEIWSCKHFLQASSCLTFTQICQLFFMYCGWGYKCLLVLSKSIYISSSYLGLIFFLIEKRCLFILKLGIIFFFFYCHTLTRRKKRRRRKKKRRSPCLLTTITFFKWS